ncbi:MAG: alkyl hydroperoxide reductase subunit F [Inhella sp.]|jgi:alkyl hydroperoxide reductase subunit F|uniref:alkyl hydroperoxide reductase subunit F n=1 Tax=Inhella sp. TaxID=1921806 RepID=UPI0022BAAE27|nr:alkyl hydroperoxide reductase subunit F [Inhella sp.]MCZ8236685.1 alkyl hydroperoxide reductase subunit F [Inhella sp.]
MLEAALKTQLATYLQRVTQPVELVATLDASQASQDLRALLDEVVEAGGGRVTLRVVDNAERSPSFTIGSPGQPARQRFAGLPLGHEFTTLVLSLLQVGGVAPKITDEQAARIRALKGPLAFDTYIGLSCHNCPDVVQALNVMSLLNPAVTSTAIDGALFQDEVKALDIMAVPAVYVNGQSFASGRMDLDELLAKIEAQFDTAGAAERAAAQAAELSAKAPYDMLIVGAGPAGAAAAVYAARKGLRVGLVADRFGGQTLDTLGIDNFISVSHTEGPQFARALENHVRDYPVEVMAGLRAAKLDTAGEPGALATVTLDNGGQLKARSLVLATGARWRELGVPGEAEYRNKGVAYCPHCDGPLFKGQRVAVVGGGNSGVEAAIDLAGIVKSVTLLEFAPALKADDVLVKKLQSLPNVTILTHVQTQEVVGEGGKVNGLRYLHRETGESVTVPLEGVFVQIGLVPNTEWLKGTLELSRYGEVVVDAKGATSAPGVFAAGDCTTVPFKQIIIATGDGAKAALGAFDALMRMPNSAALPA